MATQQPVEKDIPYWWEAAQTRHLCSPYLPKEIDVAVVGAGYAGLSAGLRLSRAGRTVAVFDRQKPGEGASSRNGGITSGNIRPSHATLLRRFGPDRTMAIEREGKAAREFLYRFLQEEGINCDLQLVGRFDGALGTVDYDKLARNAEKLHRELGVEAYAVPHAEQHSYLGTDFYRGGAVRMDIGGLHPAKFHAELLRVALEAGVTVLSRTAVLHIDTEAGGFRVATSAGEVKARQVLVCTNGYTDGALPWLQRRIVPVRSRMIATEELPSELMDRLMPRRMMCGETRELGFYYRPSPDGRRILLGGRDGSTKGNPVEPTLHLQRNLIAIFPELKDVRLTHSWFGHVAMHRDMVPRIFTRNGVVYATGFCGSGVVWAPWIGTRAADKLLGKREPASAFDLRPPPFVPLYQGKPWFMPLFMAYFRALDRRMIRRTGRTDIR